MDIELENEGMTPFLESALRLNEIYRSVLARGFNQEEPLSMIAKMIRTVSGHLKYENLGASPGHVIHCSTVA